MKYKWYSRYYYIFRNKTSGVFYVGQRKNNDVGTYYFGSGPEWVRHCDEIGGYTHENLELVECHFFEKEDLARQWLDDLEEKEGPYWLEENKKWSNQIPEDTNNNPRPGLNRETIQKGVNTKIERYGTCTPGSGKLRWFRNETQEKYCDPIDQPSGWWEGRIPTKGSKGLKWFNNGEEQLFIHPGEQPEGWLPGMLPKESKGKIPYTNGKETSRFFEGEQPEGWRRGNHWVHRPPKDHQSFFDLEEKVTVFMKTEDTLKHPGRYVGCSSDLYRTFMGKGPRKKRKKQVSKKR